MFGKIKYVLKKNLNMKTSYVVGITVLSLFLVVGGISVALYTSQAESRGSLNIVTGELASLMESEDLSNQKLTIKENEEKIITVNIKNSNNTDMKFNLYYTPVEGVEVKYYEDYDIPPKEEGEIINKNQTKKYTLSIKNKNSSDKEITFGSDVGLKKKDLPFPAGKKIIDERKIDVVKDDNMIPVVYDENKKSWVVANEENWYDYDHQKWANAVTLDKTKVLDLSGNNKIGETVGNPQFTSEGLVLDGNDDGVFIGDKIKDLFKKSNTVQFKVKLNSKPRHIFMGNFFPGGENKIINYEAHNRYYRIYVDGGIIDKTYPEVTIQKWILVTYIFDKENGKVSVYEDDKLIAEDFNSYYSQYNNDLLLMYIGRDRRTGADAPFLGGTIEKIMMYQDKLTEEEIRKNINTTVGTTGENGVVEDNLVLYYDFREESLLPGTPIPMDIIDTMWVYVPRYSYTIGSEDGVNYYGKQGEYLSTTPTRELPGEFDIKFISTNQKEKEVPQYKVKEGIKGWYTPDGFTFGEKELPGVWIGKFEPSSSNPSASNGGDNVTNLDPMIKPNVTSWRNIQLANAEEVSVKMTQPGNRYGFSQKFDAHLTKNSEWALASYLSQSKYGKLGNSAYSGVNKEVYPNIDETFKTGCSYGQVTLEATENIEYICHYSYDNIPNGTGASTTGTIYGIYDMSGGAWEHVAGNYFVDGKHYTALSGYKGYNQNSEFIEGKDFLADKYYDFYKTNNPLTACNNRPCYSHGLNEVSSMYYDANANLSNNDPWYVRSGLYNWARGNGVFANGYFTGRSYSTYSFRIALVEN